MRTLLYLEKFQVNGQAKFSNMPSKLLKRKSDAYELKAHSCGADAHRRVLEEVCLPKWMKTGTRRRAKSCRRCALLTSYSLASASRAPTTHWKSASDSANRWRTVERGHCSSENSSGRDNTTQDNCTFVRCNRMHRCAQVSSRHNRNH